MQPAPEVLQRALPTCRGVHARRQARRHRVGRGLNRHLAARQAGNQRRRMHITCEACCPPFASVALVLIDPNTYDRRQGGEVVSWGTSG